MNAMDEGNQRRERFEALLGPVLDSAYGMALHLTRRRDDAEDLVQGAAVQAYRAFHQFQEGSNFKAWFFQILINKFRYDFRKRQRQPQTAPLDDAPDLYLYIQMSGAGLIDSGEDPAAKVLGRMTEEQIGEALGELPDDFREACALYFLEDMPYQEIAEVLGCPVGTVRSRLHRGRKLLQKALWTVAQDYGIVSSLTAGSPAAGGRKQGAP
jgi:RNA polymerase sigma-70 factor (ECF subfamily)